MFNVGDYVTRKKYNNDIVFKIKEIINNKVILHGVDVRICADCTKDDLQKVIYKKKQNRISNIKEIVKNDFFYIPGIILHIDSDEEYIKLCKEFYEKQQVNYISYQIEEKELKDKVNNLIKKHNPNIVVITGHDAYQKKGTYRNSKYYIETVKQIRNMFNNEIIIISGACQSDFIGLIKAGSTFASSPKKINIHALDPAIIASYIALTNNYEEINIKEILSKTTYGEDGIGGSITKGTMKVCYPRIKKEKNEHQ